MIFSNNNKTDVTMRLKRLFLGIMLFTGITGAGAANAAPEDISASISLKVPGNDAKQYPLALQKMQDGMYSCRASEKLPSETETSHFMARAS